MRAYLPDFQMSVAQDLPSALTLMAQGFRPFAGGTDIMVVFNAGKFAPVPLVNIRKLPELSQIALTPEFVEIGAAVTYTQIRQHGVLCAEFSLLTQSASWTGSVANQNRGTLGGNIANASPAADSSPVLLVYDAELKLVSNGGQRWTPYSKFHLGYKAMAMDSDELIAAIRLPRSPRATAEYGRKVGARRAQAISKVSFASGVFNGAARIAVGSVAPVSLRCVRTEELLRGQRMTRAVIEKAKQTLCMEISPITDIRSTSDYRFTVTENLLGEFLESLP